MSDYKITIKVRNAPLLKAIKKAGFKNVSDFIHKNKLPVMSVNRFINLSVAPYDSSKGDFKPLALKIANILGCTVWDIFPLHHIEIPLVKSESEIDLSLDDIKNISDILNPEQILLNFERREIINDAMDLLNSREKEIIEARYRYGLTYDNIGAEFGISNQRVIQIERKAFEKMTKGPRKRKLKDLL